MILRKKVFQSSSKVSSVTSVVSHDVCYLNDKVVKVVDAPGVCDTRYTNDVSVNKYRVAMEHAVLMNPKGYHAVLIVLKYGNRFTEEDQKTVDIMKKVFGDDFVKDYCIVVFTGGDTFAKEFEGTLTSFETWLMQQDGGLKTLVQECQSRAILFDNFTTDDSEINRQRTSLIRMVQRRMNNDGKRYTNEVFLEAREAREKLMIESKIPMIRDETMSQVSLLMDRLSEVQSSDSTTKLDDLKKLKQMSADFTEKIRKEDKGTNALKQYLQAVQSVETTIQEAIIMQQKEKEDKERETKMKASLEEAITREKEKLRAEKEKEIELEKIKIERDVEMKNREDIARIQDQMSKLTTTERERAESEKARIVLGRREEYNQMKDELERKMQQQKHDYEERLRQMKDERIREIQEERQARMEERFDQMQLMLKSNHEELQAAKLKSEETIWDNLAGVGNSASAAFSKFMLAWNQLYNIHA